VDAEEPMTMSTDEAAARLGCGKDWLARQARAGLVPHVKFGRSRRFTEAHLVEIVASREQVASDPWVRSNRSEARGHRY